LYVLDAWDGLTEKKKTHWQGIVMAAESLEPIFCRYDLLPGIPFLSDQHLYPMASLHIPHSLIGIRQFVVQFCPALTVGSLSICLFLFCPVDNPLF
jgi:hypothetical protein